MHSQHFIVPITPDSPGVGAKQVHGERFPRHSRAPERAKTGLRPHSKGERFPRPLERPREGQDWPQATQRRREIPPPTLETQRGPRLASGHTAKPWEGRNWKPCTEALPSMSPLGMGVLALFPYWTLLSEHCSATLGHTHDTPPAPSPGSRTQ